MAVDAGGAARKVPAWDPPLTVLLLIIAVINVTQIVANARDLPAFLTMVFVGAGVGNYTPISLDTGIGYAMCGVSVATLIAAIAVAVPRLRGHRLAFWVPLLFAVVNGIVLVVLLTVLGVNHPNLLTSVGTVGG